MLLKKELAKDNSRKKQKTIDKNIKKHYNKIRRQKCMTNFIFWVDGRVAKGGRL